MNKPDVRAILESLLLAARKPVPLERLQSVLDDIDPGTVLEALRSLEFEYAGEARGIHLVRVAGGYQFRTNPAFGARVRAFLESEPVRLSPAAMETLAIVAYRQPLTRAEIEEIRGVNCSGVLNTLREYDLVDIIGRLDDIGKPHIYGTTERFLTFFGLDDLSDLPTLDESEMQALIDNFDEFPLDEPDPESQEPSEDTEMAE